MGLCRFQQLFQLAVDQSPKADVLEDACEQGSNEAPGFKVVAFAWSGSGGDCLMAGKTKLKAKAKLNSFSGLWLSIYTVIRGLTLRRQGHPGAPAKGSPDIHS